MDAFVQLLQIEGVSTVGLALTGFALYVIALWREWIVTGKRWSAKVKDGDNLTAALDVAHGALKQCERDYTEARISIARHEERDRVQGWTPPRKRGAS